jgi:alpha-tubulin suppressor-like RCC1 family protein
MRVKQPLIRPLARAATAATIAAVLAVLLLPAAASATGGVMAWGDNAYGQLGDGTTTGPETCVSGSPCSTIPVAVSGLKEVVALAPADGFHSLALLSNATVMAWGDNKNGQLGNGTHTGPETCVSGSPCSTTPVAVSGLKEVTAIGAGYEHSLALLSNGTVMAWGNNGFGELGNGTTTNSDAPVPVSGLTEVVAISAGYEDSFALRKNGTVMAWGYNVRGELGNGTTTNSDAPVPVSGLTEVVAISAGFEHSVALLKNGTVMDWGENSVGQLGNGMTTNSSVPVAVSGLKEVAAIKAGAYHSHAILSNGTVMGWGDNFVGDLGDGTSTGPEACYTSCSKTPVPVSGLKEVAALAGGGEVSLALLSNGAVKAWADNDEGELGVGTSMGPEFCAGHSCSTIPVAVSGLSGVTAISAGNYFSAALVGGPPPPTVTKVEPNTGLPSGGTKVTITGTGFTGATAVKFGPTSTKRFTVTSATAIAAVSPDGKPGATVDVTVTTPAGTSPTSPADRFTYQGGK